MLSGVKGASPHNVGSLRVGSLRGSFRSNLDLIGINIIILLFVSFGIVRTFALYENSLLVEPQWTATKATLRRGVMGAIAFVSGPQSLARNRLNLGSWFGFQEVLYRDSLELANLEFRFRVEDDGYIHVLYDYRDDGFSGVRLSSRAEFPSSSYQATLEGEFTRIETLPLPSLTPNLWHRVQVTFEDDKATVALDDEGVGVFRRSPGRQRVGFRGGQRNAWIDDVILTGRDGRIHRDRFTNTHRQWQRLGVVFGGLSFLTVVGFLAARTTSSVPPRDIGMGMLMCFMILGCMVAPAYVMQYVRGSNYGLLSSGAARAEAYWINSSREEILAGIRSRYTVEVPPDVVRILVLGTSQTWGAGAKRDEDVWVQQLERRLNEIGGGRRVECINAGVSGLVTKQVRDMLHTDLAGFAATAAIVNLSNNDIDTAEFQRNLGELAFELSARKIRTVFVLEPNSLERRLSDSRHGNLAAKHALVRAVAARHGAPVVDLHGYLAQRKDAGFLWWDFVHLTSFGQRLVADKLAADLPALLGINQPQGVSKNPGS